MKKIKLLNLKLVNFKGIKEFGIDLNGNDVKIFGENGTGKTTLFDAFVWLLFNKDSANNSTNRMGIKTVDSQGNVIHRLDHEVEATLQVDDDKLTLKKVYKEQWTKQRGSVTESFSGHTTDHFINGVPSKKKEYDEMIQSIVDEDVFQLLTNPTFFNEKIHWKDRRDLLLEVAGDVTDDDVIASRSDLAKLKDVLNGNSIEDHKKIIAAKRREINDKIKEIPTRIDEIHRNLPDITGLDEAKIKTDIDKLSFEIEEKNEQINSIRSGSEVNALKKQISDIELKLANVSNEHMQQNQHELFKLKTRLQEEQSNLNLMRGDLQNKEQQKQSNVEEINRYKQTMDELRKEYAYEDSKKFDHEANCKCPTCEQDLPQEQVSEIATRFNVNKAKTLERINVKGKSLKEKVEELQQENETLQKVIDKITADGKKKASDIERLEKQVKDAESNVTPIEENADYIKLNEEKQALEQQIDRIEQSIDESVSKVRKEIETLKERQNALQVDLNTIAQVDKSKERIEELEEEEKELATEYEQLEHQLYLTEEFTRTKVEMLTENINSKFKYARFNLFQEQINGGLEEVCETTYEGVPYGSGLNDGHKIIVGLDIINTLSNHYGVQAPIFVDNAEAVTNELTACSQLIRLMAQKGDKELRVETDASKESEVA